MMTRKEQFEAAYWNADADCKDCLEHAKSAMEGNRNSDYMFWMQQYTIAFERKQHFFIEMLNCND